VRALPVALTLMDQARARKHETDLSNRLTDQAFGLLGRDAVPTIIGRQNAGGGIVIRLPGRVLTGGRAAAIEAAGAASQIPADGNPEVYDEGFWSRVNALAGQFGLTGPGGIVQASAVPGAG
jgi:hypothetical protein